MSRKPRTVWIYLSDAQKQRIVDLRLDRGWNQEQCAEVAGFGKRSMQAIEGDEPKVNRQHLRLLSKAFKMELEEMLNTREETVKMDEIPAQVLAWLQSKLNSKEKVVSVTLRVVTYSLLLVSCTISLSNKTFKILVYNTGKVNWFYPFYLHAFGMGLAVLAYGVDWRRYRKFNVTKGAVIAILVCEFIKIIPILQTMSTIRTK